MELEDYLNDMDSIEEEPTTEPQVLEIGCLFGEKCCMPGEHYTVECHTGDMIEAQYRAFNRWEKLRQEYSDSPRWAEIKQRWKDLTWLKYEDELWLLNTLRDLLD